MSAPRFALALLAASVSHPPPVPVSMFGVSLAGPGDVDGDGVPDVLIAAPVAGNCYLMSGRDGHVLRVLPGGAEVAAPGDVDGDGVPDLMVSKFGWPGEDSPHSFVYSGKDGHELYGYPESHVAAAGDLDHDGRADFIVGSDVFSGRDGRVLLALSGTGLRGVGDVDGDGTLDFAGIVNRSVRVCSGKDGAILHSFGIWAGRPAACCIGVGDLDGDGCTDLAVGYPDEECNQKMNYARVFSGKTGQVLHDFSSTVALFGASFAAPGDLDGDGRPDLVIGAYDSWGSEWGEAFVYSGVTWKQIGHLSSNVSERGFGIALSSLGDVDKDGVGDFAVGACKWTWPSGPAFVFVYSGKTRQLLLTLSPPGK